MIHALSSLGEFLSNSTLSHRNVQNLMKNEKHFDAVVVEVFWVEALYGKSVATFNANTIRIASRQCWFLVVSELKPLLK
jgi:hypothetical protein